VLRTSAVVAAVLVDQDTDVGAATKPLQEVPNRTNPTNKKSNEEDKVIIPSSVVQLNYWQYCEQSHLRSAMLSTGWLAGCHQ